MEFTDQRRSRSRIGSETLLSRFARTKRGVDPLMKSALDYRDGHLCVLNESELGVNNPYGPVGNLREWYPVREASEAEVAILIGRPVMRVTPDEGLYADEEGNPYQLLERASTRPLAVEMIPAARDSERAGNETESGKGDGQTPAAVIAAQGASPGRVAAGAKPKMLLRRPRKKRRVTAGDGTDGQPGHERLPG
jgi:hypothetical protein